MTTAELVPLIKKHPIGLACGVISLACCLLLYFGRTRIGEYQKLNEEKTAEASAAIANVRNSEKLGEQTAALQAANKELESRLMRAGQLAGNLQYFYRMEAETEVKMIDVRQGSTRTGARTTSFIGVPYSVSVQGTFPQVLTFLGRLQKGHHFCRFISVGLTKAGDEQLTLNLNLEILGLP